MKFLMQKNRLVDALNRMNEIATKGVKTEFDMAGLVTIESAANKVAFYTTNGHLDAKWEVTEATDANIKGNQAGRATVSVPVAARIVKALGGTKNNDAVVSVEIDGGNLNLSIADGKKKNAKATMETFNKHHELDFSKPGKGSSTFSFDTPQFVSGILSVSPYCSYGSYKMRYQMICLHLLPDATRLICGDGSRFAVLQLNESTNKGIDAADGVKYLIPVDQANIISRLVDNSQTIDLTFKNATWCYISPKNGMEMVLKGIPNETYIPYELHAFQTDKAVCVVDADRQELDDAMALVRAVRDKSIETDGGFLSCKFTAVEGKELKLEVDEGRYHCDVSVAVNFSKISESSFSSVYAEMFMSEVAAVTDHDIVRFYCVDEKGTMLVEPGNLDKDSKPNDKGYMNLQKNGKRLVFFFASASEE